MKSNEKNYNLDEDEQMAISGSKRGSVCYEFSLVQKAGTVFSPCQETENSRTTVRLLIEERYTWQVRAVLLGGGDDSHLLPDSYVSSNFDWTDQ